MVMDFPDGRRRWFMWTQRPIRDDSPFSPEQGEQVAIIKSGGQAVEKQIADILDLSKIEAGKSEIESSPFGLHKHVEVIAFFQPRARGALLTLAANIAPDVPAFVNSDERRMRQILTHLIRNTLKLTEQGGITVHVSCLRGEPVSMRDSRRALRLFFAVNRHRHRHPGGQDLKALQALPPGRDVGRAPPERHRRRPDHLEASLRIDGGFDFRREQAPRRHDLPLLAADRV
jgi:hypothetical protein